MIQRNMQKQYRRFHRVPPFHSPPTSAASGFGRRKGEGAGGDRAAARTSPSRTHPSYATDISSASHTVGRGCAPPSPGGLLWLQRVMEVACVQGRAPTRCPLPSASCSGAAQPRHPRPTPQPNLRPLEPTPRGRWLDALPEPHEACGTGWQHTAPG